MEGFAAGMQVAEALQELRALIDGLRLEHATYRVEHELDAGAHAAAFNAHGASPGVVEAAEETAASILDTALETLEDAADAAVATVEAAGEGAAEGTDAAVEAVAEPVAEVATTASEPVKAVADEVKPERTPHRPHALHRPIRLFGRG